MDEPTEHQLRFRRTHLRRRRTRRRFMLPLLVLVGAVLLSVALMATPVLLRDPGFTVAVILITLLAILYTLAFLALASAYRLARERDDFAAALLCTKCGYDLRGNQSGICPECGTQVEADDAEK
jgi:uncharacterized paraquat-inducible protein A